ncbi:MAG: TetR/AcrR family transcriptional regulator [bacterium]
MQPLKNQHLPESSVREEEILGHAFDLVRESGLSGLTMKKVAERVGFTETAAYRYFPTKVALIQALARRLFGPFISTARSIAADTALSPSERLERVVRQHVDLIIRTDGLPVLILAEACAGGSEDLLGMMRTGLGNYLGLLESLLADATPPGHSVRPEDKALVLFGISAVIAVRRRLGLEPEASDRIRSDLLPFVVRSLTAKEGAC